MKKELICVVCPAGCRMTAEVDERGTVTDVTGNTCPRGRTYAEGELTRPVRTLTSTVKVRTGEGVRLLPVKTSRPIPKASLLSAMGQIRALTVTAPVVMGDILIRDFIEAGTNLVSCKSI